jgi:c-di-GMP-binding flagellar brake protein YcgR
MAPKNELTEPEKPRVQRRAFPRYPVDCPATITFLTGAGQISGRMADLSLGGCRLATDQRVLVGIMIRVEVQFQLRGIAFRVVGVAAGTRTGKSFAIRFLDMPRRRYDELAEVIAELEATGSSNACVNAPQTTNAAASIENSAAAAAAPMLASDVTLVAASSAANSHEQVKAARESSSSPDPLGQTSNPAPSNQMRSNQAPAANRDRRSHSRHSVDTRVNLLLVKGGISMPGCILNLSQGGCRLRTDERLNVGIYVRVEAEFYLHGLPFRLAGVSQAILDKNTIGVRFLDMSERRREQLTELIAEIEEAEQCGMAIGGSVEFPEKMDAEVAAEGTFKL